MWYAAVVEKELAIGRLMFNFMPSWWYRNYGIEYGRKMVFDPDYRIETYLRMERLVHERYSAISVGSPNPQPIAIGPDLQNAVTAAAAGCEVTCPPDNYPCSDHLPPEAISRLRVPDDLSKVFPYREIDRQVAYLNRKLGRDDIPWWNVRGVQNDAVLIKGSDFLEDYYANPEGTTALLDYTFGMLTSIVRHNHTAGHRGMVMLTNCTVMMVSPQTYEHWLLPYDLRIHDLARELGLPFGIHHCGRFDTYARVYRKIPSVDFWEIGWESDIASALDQFPEATVQSIFNTSYLASANMQEIAHKTEEILEAARLHPHRFQLSVPDIEYGTPDENLVEIYRRCQQAT